MDFGLLSRGRDRRTVDQAPSIWNRLLRLPNRQLLRPGWRRGSGARSTRDAAVVIQIGADLVNVRGGPGTGYPIVAQTASGARFAVSGRDDAGQWWQICCPNGGDESGWISGALVELVRGPERIEDVPVAEAPALPSAPLAVVDSNNQAALAAAPAAGLPGEGGFGAAGATNPLTGLSLPANTAGKRPMVVCINNDFAARPQYGIGQADIMYEYIMEGFGITRFSGVYFGDDVGQIGPVRSARLINYYLGALYDAGLACSGASDGVRYTLKHEAPFPYLDVDLDDPSNTRYSVSIGSDYRTRLRTATESLRPLAGGVGRRESGERAWVYLWCQPRRRRARGNHRHSLSKRNG